ncbi:MAG: hypothetical protein R6U11_04655, partial [Bacteroidales bacterium]
IEVPIVDLAKIVIDITGSKSKIVYHPPLPEGDMKRRFPDTSKMRKLLNRNVTPLEAGIRKIIENPDFILPEINMV